MLRKTGAVRKPLHSFLEGLRHFSWEAPHALLESEDTVFEKHLLTYVEGVERSGWEARVSIFGDFGG